MENFFDPDSWIMTALSNLGDLIIANILWVITSIPIITLGASTAALYSVVRTPGEKRYSASVFKNYFRAFRRSFKQGTLTMLLLLIPAAVIVINLYLLLFGLLEDSLVRYVICAVPVLVFVLAWSWVYPLMANFDNSVGKTVTNALVLSVAHLPTSLLVTLVNLIPALVLLFFTDLFFKIFIIWLLLAFALIARVNTLLLERVFRRYLPETQE